MEKTQELALLGMTVQADKNQLAKCNEMSGRFGLTLTQKAMQNLQQGRLSALNETGRLEFTGGILPLLVREFCDSPHIRQSNYEETLLELQSMFYDYKNESLDMLTDEELVEYMKNWFDGRAQGSFEYLRTLLDSLCRSIRTGEPFDEDGGDAIFDDEE